MINIGVDKFLNLIGFVKNLCSKYTFVVWKLVFWSLWERGDNSNESLERVGEFYNNGKKGKMYVCTHRL